MQQFSTRLLPLSSNHRLIRHGLSSTNRHCGAARSCRPAGASIWTVTAVTGVTHGDLSNRCGPAVTADPTTTTIAMVTAPAISVITTARWSLWSNGRDYSDSNCGHIDHGDHGGQCGPYSCRGGFADSGRLCGTASRRWPVCRPAATAARRLVGRWRPPPLAHRIARQCPPPLA